MALHAIKTAAQMPRRRLGFISIPCFWVCLCTVARDQCGFRHRATEFSQRYSVTRRYRDLASIHLLFVPASLTRRRVATNLLPSVTGKQQNKLLFSVRTLCLCGSVVNPHGSPAKTQRPINSLQVLLPTDYSCTPARAVAGTG